MEGSLSEVGIPPPHNSDIHAALVAGYTHTHTHTYIMSHPRAMSKSKSKADLF